MEPQMEAVLAADAARRTAFAALQPRTTALLQLRTQPKALAAALCELTAEVQQQEPAGVAGCLEYTLLPLLFLIDSVVATRAASPGAPAAEPPFPAAKSDAVAEAALATLAAVLEVAAPQAPDTLVPLLERVLRVAALPRSSAPEEVRGGGLRALAAALQGIRERAPAAAAALRMEEHAPLVGHMASVLLQAASGEVEGGSTGSAAVRAAALGALRLLVEAVGSGDALAFFVPGLVSGLGKALAAAGTAHGARVRSGPAAGSAAAVQAVAALVAVCRATLGDSTARQRLAPKPQSSGDALAALQRLAMPSALQTPAASEPPPQPPQRQPMPESPSFRVQRDGPWLRQTADRVGGVLVQALPPLQGHPHASVRAAVTHAAADLLDSCSVVLPQRATAMLLDCLLSAAQDEWAAVSEPARAWLAARPSTSGASSADGRHLPWLTLEAAIVALIDGLPAAAQAGDAALILHARRLTTALQAAPAAVIVNAVLANPARRTALISAFCAALEFDRAAAPLLLHAGASDAGPRAIEPVQQYAAATARDGEGAVAHQADTAQEAAELARQPGAQTPPQMPEQAAAALPHFPMGLAYVGSRQAYASLATAMRMTGRLAVSASADAPDVLRGMLEEALQRLRSGLERGSGDTGGWQEGCAAAATVATEMLHGASPAWRDTSCLLGPAPDIKAVAAPSGAAAMASSPGTSEDRTGNKIQQPSAAADGGAGVSLSRGAAATAEVARCTELLLELLSDERLAGLPTHAEAAAAAAASRHTGPRPASGLAGGSVELAAHQWTPQVLGENAMLVRVVLESFGAAAVSLGPAFVRPGTLLRLVLLPTLERIGDPCAPVAAAGDAAIACICTHCGYEGSLSRLLAENADYVVDGVCARLRAMNSNSRAPQLLAAVLGRSGCGAGLLPLLTEAAAAALRGLSVTARRAHPSASVPFLQALTAMCSGAAADAADVAADYKQLAEVVNARLQDAEAAAAAAPPLVGSMHIEDIGQLPPDDGDGPGDDATIDEIQDYFLKRQQEQQQAASAPTKVPLTAAEWERLDGLARRMGAGAKIAGAAADVAAPLLLSADLKVALLAIGAARAAFQVLRDTSTAADIDSQLREALEPRAGAEPLPPDPPRLLPAVYVLWAPLVTALRDERAALAERAASATAEVAAVAGAQFLASRWRAEAWPPLRQMLAGRPAPRPSPGLAPDERRPAPGAAQRLRLAALRSIAATALAAAAADVLQIVASDVAEHTAACLSDGYPPAIHGAASEALLALAAVDSDAVWLALESLAAAAADAPPPPRPPGPAFPSFMQVLPLRPGLRQSAAAGNQTDAGSSRRAAALLGRLPIGANWHSRAQLGDTVDVV